MMNLATEVTEPGPSPLETLFSSGARDAVLRLFMTDPTRAYYQRQIEQATGQPIRAVQREVSRLSGIGLLFRRVEGNRIYYHVDQEHLLYPELRSMVIKTSDALGKLRGWASTANEISLAFIDRMEKRVLLVTRGAAGPPAEVARAFKIELMPEDKFSEILDQTPETLDAFLRDGTDLLGRRDDVIWRRIERAGFRVEKSGGVA